MMQSLKKHSDIAHLILRLVIAAIFLYHGSQKWMFWSSTPEGMPANMLVLFKFLSIVEPLGGLALVLGVLTRYASLGLGIIMIGAIYMKWSAGFATAQGPGWEFDLMILAGCIALMFEGAGKYSVDAKMKM